MKSLISIAIILAVFCIGCQKPAQSDSNETVISGKITSQEKEGKITEKYKYDANGNISEVTESMYSYNKFTYNANGRLISEVASSLFIDEPAVLPVPLVLFNSQSPIFYRYDYSYSNNGQLSEIKTFVNHPITGWTETERKTYEHQNGRIHKENWFAGNTNNYYSIFEYDNNGNLKYERVFNKVHTPTFILSAQTEYTFDQKANPFIIFQRRLRPGINTNPNNIVRIQNTVFSAETPSQATVINSTDYQYTYIGQFPITRKRITSDNTTLTKFNY